MRLLYNWGDVLKRAWSVRLNVLAAILSPLAIALPIIVPLIPNKYLVGFALIVFAVNLGAIGLRVLKQPDLPDETECRK